MVTTRRLENYTEEKSMDFGGVKVLERKVPTTYNEYNSTQASETDLEEARLRMQKNLEKLLNYDRYAEQESVTSELQTQSDTRIDEDMRPTSTTMQFAKESTDTMIGDLESMEEEKSASKLSLKGKIVVGIYSAVVAIVFALIVLNTGVLASLTGIMNTKTAILNEKINEYNAVSTQIDEISSNEYIENIAKEDYGMIVKD